MLTLVCFLFSAHLPGRYCAAGRWRFHRQTYVNLEKMEHNAGFGEHDRQVYCFCQNVNNGLSHGANESYDSAIPAICCRPSSGAILGALNT